MTISTVNPFATVSTGAVTAVGAASLHAALNDANDATYVRNNADFVFNFPSVVRGPGVGDAGRVVLAANQRCKRARITGRGSGHAWEFYLSSGVAFAAGESAVGTVQQVTSSWSNYAYDGSNYVEWTQTYLDNVQMGCDMATPGGENYAADAVRWHKVYVEFDIYTRSVATITAPAGTVTTTTRPPVSWTFAQAEGDAQKKYEVSIWSGTVDPNASPGTPLHTSGQVADAAARSYTPTVDLDSGTYTFAIRTASDFNGTDWWSTWSYTTRSVLVPTPAVPAVTATVDDANARVVLLLQGRTNMLTKNQASAETDSTGMSTGTGAVTVARDTAQFLDGAASWKVTSNATGNVNMATTGTGLTAIPVVGSKQYTAMGWCRAGQAVTTETARIQITWYDAAGATISTSSGTATAPTNSGWTQLVLTTNSPSNAAFARVIFQIQSNATSGFFYYWDQNSLAPGNSTAWSPGGYSAAFQLTLEFSDDAGTTWTVDRNSPFTPSSSADQSTTVYDYEVPPRKTRQYRSRATADTANQV